MRASDQSKNKFQNSHDKQINDPLHDRIVLWLHHHLSKLDRPPTFVMPPVEKKYYASKGGVESYLDYDWKWAYNSIGIETAIGEKYVCGFADLVVTSVYKSDTYYYVDTSRNEEFEAKKTEIGKLDLTERWQKLRELELTPMTYEKVKYHRQSEMPVQYCIEVKSSVNVGETVRQINYYKASDSRVQNWLVCAPGTQHAAVLKTQGIGYIPYTGPMR